MIQPGKDVPCTTFYSDDGASVEIAYYVDDKRTQLAPPGDNLAYSINFSSSGWGSDTQLGHTFIKPPATIRSQAAILILLAKHGMGIPPLF